MNKFLDKVIEQAILSGNVSFLEEFIAAKKYSINYEHITLSFKATKNSAAILNLLLNSCSDSFGELKKFTLTNLELEQLILVEADKYQIKLGSNFNKIELIANKNFCFARGERDNQWYLANIEKQVDKKVFIHYEGYTSLYDTWVDITDASKFLIIQDIRIRNIRNLQLVSMVDMLLNLINIDPQCAAGLMLWKEIILAPEMEPDEKDMLLLELVALGVNFEFFAEHEFIDECGSEQDFIFCEGRLRP